jgi:hypothetical protein
MSLRMIWAKVTTASLASRYAESTHLFFLELMFDSRRQALASLQKALTHLTKPNFHKVFTFPEM